MSSSSGTAPLHKSTIRTLFQEIDDSDSGTSHGSVKDDGENSSSNQDATNNSNDGNVLLTSTSTKKSKHATNDFEHDKKKDDNDNNFNVKFALPGETGNVTTQTHGTRRKDKRKSIYTQEDRSTLFERRALSKSWLVEQKVRQEVGRNIKGIFHVVRVEAGNSIQYTILSLVIQLVFGWKYCFPDGKEDEETACNTNLSMGQSSINMGMCNLHLSLSSGHSNLRVLAAFILGGFVRMVIIMWNTRRSAYCEICGSVKVMLVNIRSLVRPCGAKHTLERWTLLGYELSVLDARGLADTEEGRSHLENLGLLAEGEWDVMIDGDRHNSVWFWFQKLVVKLYDEGLLPSEMALMVICNAITKILDDACDLMSCMDRDQPVPYRVVITLVINLSLFTFSVSKGTEWAILNYETNGAIWRMPQMYAEIFLSLTYNAVFASLYNLCHWLHNPFGPRTDIDIPHAAVGAGLRQLAKKLPIQDDPPTLNTDKDSDPQYIGINVEDDDELLEQLHEPSCAPSGLMSKSFRSVRRFSRIN